MVYMMSYKSIIVLVRWKWKALNSSIVKVGRSSLVSLKFEIEKWEVVLY